MGNDPLSCTGCGCVSVVFIFVLLPSVDCVLFCRVMMDMLVVSTHANSVKFC